jgi:FkbM family methyltransferase
MANAMSKLKSVVPPSVWEPARGLWYKTKNLKYLKYYPAGLAFDLFMRDYRTEGMTFKIPREYTTRIHRARFYLDTHEADERKLAREFIDPAATVLELGACLGVVSCVINRQLRDPARHVAVEANPNLIAVLEENRARNSCKFAIESGMISKTSDGTFYIDDCLVVSGPVVESERKIKVPVFSIEDLERKHGMQFDTLFMDIQGGECALLDEHQEFLQRVRTIILEFHPHLVGAARVAQTRERLKSGGLSVVETRGLTQVWQRR